MLRKGKVDEELKIQAVERILVREIKSSTGMSISWFCKQASIPTLAKCVQKLRRRGVKIPKE